MRKIAEIKYTTIIQSDVSKDSIYAFRHKQDIAFLCRKDDLYFWKCLCAVNMVWHQMYSSVEGAIEGILKVSEYKDACKNNLASPVMEFDSTKEFIEWAYSELPNLKYRHD